MESFLRTYWETPDKTDTGVDALQQKVSALILEAKSDCHDAIVDGIFACADLAASRAEIFDKSKDMSDCDKAVESLEEATRLADELHLLW